VRDKEERSCELIYFVYKIRANAADKGWGLTCMDFHCVSDTRNRFTLKGSRRG
jgi:hypothetical protein